MRLTVLQCGMTQKAELGLEPLLPINLSSVVRPQTDDSQAKVDVEVLKLYKRLGLGFLGGAY